MSRPELFAEYVPAERVTLQDLQLLERADAAGPAYQSLPESTVLDLIAKGELHLLRTRPSPGVLLLEVRKGASGRQRLGIVRASGRGLGWIARPVAELLQHTAREWGCEAVETMVYSPRVAQALTRVGAKAESVNMVLGAG